MSEKHSLHICLSSIPNSVPHTMHGLGITKSASADNAVFKFKSGKCKEDI